MSCSPASHLLPYINYGTCPPGCAVERRGRGVRLTVAPPSPGRTLVACAGGLAWNFAVIMCGLLAMTAPLVMRGQTTAATWINLLGGALSAVWLAIDGILLVSRRGLLIATITPRTLRLQMNHGRGRGFRTHWDRTEIRRIRPLRGGLRIDAGAPWDLGPLLYLSPEELAWLTAELRDHLDRR